MRSQKVIDEVMRGTAQLLRAAQGPPPPPLTRWQRTVIWFDRNMAEPLASVCYIIAAAAAARFGWELFQ